MKTHRLAGPLRALAFTLALASTTTTTRLAAQTPLQIAQQAYLKASNTRGGILGVSDGENFGYAVAVWGDTAVVGAPYEDCNATGVNGNQSDTSATDAGAAYVFVRHGTNWVQQAYLKASNTDGTSASTLFGDMFGQSVAVSGDTIVVGAPGEHSNATGVNGNQSDNSLPGAGAAYVFVRSGSNWTQQAYLKASNPDAHDQFGFSVAISDDKVVVGALAESSNATGVNGNQDDNSATDSGAAYVFVRQGANWSQQAYLKASNTGATDLFGGSVAVSGDTIVVGAGGEDSSATGVNGNQSDNSIEGAGAAYVFVRNGTSWSQQAYLKASNTGPNHGPGVVFGDGFGAVAVSGDTIVVGAHSESSNATGVNGNQSDNSALQSGAAYVFVRHGTNWSQQAYLKASNTGAFDIFGAIVAVSGDTVVIAAPFEASSASGINGNQSNNTAPSSGAVYLFVRNGTTWSQPAYLKASNAEASDQFGFSVASSGDTVVVGSLAESSNAIGANGNQSDNSAFGAGAAYVFMITDARPRLAIARAGTGTLTLSWPSPSTGWNLEQNTTLTGGIWTTPPEPINDDGATKSITVNTASGNRFFRLAQ